MISTIRERLVQPILDFNEIMQPVFQSINTKMSEIGDLIRKHIDESDIENAVTRFKQGIIETEEDLKIFKSVMVEMGYPPHEGIDISTVRTIAQSYKENKESITPDVIQEFMCVYYDSKFIKTISLEWENNKVIQKRLPILRNVVMAHNQGMYNVAIPTILTQLESLLVDAFHIKGKVNGEIIKILWENLLKNNEDANLNFDREIHDYYVKNILIGFEHGKAAGSEISRNAILHGADIDYGQLLNSIKTILLFDCVVNAVFEMDEKKVSNGKTAVRNYRKANYR
ncbi:hypothetical protein [Peribacillus loiseleuriae]|nr:hypothetical protein [Peribacillus loiseleuriae]